MSVNKSSPFAFTAPLPPISRPGTSVSKRQRTASSGSPIQKGKENSGQSIASIVLKIAIEFLDKTDIEASVFVNKQWRVALLSIGKQDNDSVCSYISAKIFYFNSIAVPTPPLAAFKFSPYPVITKQHKMKMVNEVIVNQILVKYINVDIDSPELYLTAQSLAIRNNNELMLLAQDVSLGGYPTNFKQASQELRNDPEFGLKSLEKIDSRIVLTHISDELLHNRSFLLKCLNVDGCALQHIPEELVDIEMVSAAIKQNPSAILHAPDTYRNDPVLVLAALKNWDWSDELSKDVLEEGEIDIFAKDSILLEDETFLLAASDIMQKIILDNMYGLESEYDGDELTNLVISNDSIQMRLFKLSDKYKDNKEFVLKVVKTNPLCLKSLSGRLKNDAEIVLECLKAGQRFVQKGGLVDDNNFIKFASEALRSDKKFALIAFGQDYFTLLADFSKTLKQDEEVALAALRNYRFNLVYIPSTFFKDKKFAQKAVQIDGYALTRCEDFQDDEEIVLMAVQQYGQIYNTASPRLRNNKRIIIEAIKQDCLVINIINKEILKNIHFLRELFDFCPHLKDNRVFALIIVDINGLALQFLSERLRDDKEVVLRAIEQGGFDLKPDESILQYASPTLREDYTVVMAAVNKNGLAIQHASRGLQQNRGLILTAIQQNALAAQFFAFTFVPKRLPSSKMAIQG